MRGFIFVGVHLPWVPTQKGKWKLIGGITVFVRKNRVRCVLRNTHTNITTTIHTPDRITHNQIHTHTCTHTPLRYYTTKTALETLLSTPTPKQVIEVVKEM